MASPDHVVVIVFPHVTITVPNIGQVPEIGHAGVLLINGTSGLTKYFEYGRYDPAQLGIVQNHPIPDVTMDASGVPNPAKLKATLRSISEKAGKKTSISAVIYRTDGMFSTGLAFCNRRLAENAVPTRVPYSVLTHNCVEFADSCAKTMVDSLVAAPMFFNPVPHLYIIGVQAASIPFSTAHNLEYDFASDTLT